MTATKKRPDDNDKKFSHLLWSALVFGSEDKIEIKLLNAKCSRSRIIRQKGDNEIHLFIGFANFIYAIFFSFAHLCAVEC